MFSIRNEEIGYWIIINNMIYVLFLTLTLSFTINANTFSSLQLGINTTDSTTGTSKNFSSTEKHIKESPIKVIGLRILMMCIIIAVIFTIGLGIDRLWHVCTAKQYNNQGNYSNLIRL